MYNPEEAKEITELNELIEQELQEEENNPDYQFYIVLCRSIK